MTKSTDERYPQMLLQSNKQIKKKFKTKILQTGMMKDQHIQLLSERAQTKSFHSFSQQLRILFNIECSVWPNGALTLQR